MMDEPETVLQIFSRAVRQVASDTPFGAIAVLLVSTCILTRVFSGIRSYATKPPSVKQLPYWIPYIGHGLSWGLRRNRLLAGGRNTTDEPVFSLKLLGRTHNVIVSRVMAKKLSDEKICTSSEPCVRYLVEKVFGASKRMRKYSHADGSTISRSMDFITQEPYLSTLTSAFTRELHQTMPNFVSFSASMVDQYPWERKSEVSADEKSDWSSCDANLYDLIKHYVGSLVTTTLMGQAFTDASPEFLSDLWLFNGKFDAMLMGIPRFFPVPGLVPAYKARRSLLKSLTTFHQAFAAVEAGRDPGIDWRDLDDVSECMQTRARFWIDSGIFPEAAASEDLFVLWATNLKLSTLVFWNLVHILANDDLASQIRQEIAPYARASRSDTKETGFHIPEPPRLSLDLDRLLDSCPLFKATFYETLRLYTASFTYRKITSTMTLADFASDEVDRPPYRLSAGEYVAVPQPLLNTDPHYFKDPEKFDPNRFIQESSQEKPSESLSHDSTASTPELEGILPFAVGDAERQGEGFAGRVVMAVTASILAMWDIQPADSGPWDVPRQKDGSLVSLPRSEIRAKVKVKV